MCSFRLYDIIPSHAHDPEEYSRQRGCTARLNRGIALGGLTFPQREYHSQLHTTFSIPGYRRSAQPGRQLPGGSLGPEFKAFEFGGESFKLLICTLCATV
jgi:hypothetical protein